MLMGGRFGPPLIWPCVLDRTFCTNPVKPFINLCMLTICRKKWARSDKSKRILFQTHFWQNFNIFRFFRSQNPWNSSERYWHYLFCNFTSCFIKKKKKNFDEFKILIFVIRLEITPDDVIIKPTKSKKL